MIEMIVAISNNNIIGCDNSLPWHIREDLQYFKNITSGHAIIMGRKTYESIGKPLPNRTNIVLTNSTDLKINGVKVVYSLKDALELAKTLDTVFIIGGGEIYRLFMPYARKLYITLVDITIEGDTYFPNFNTDFKCISTTEKTDVTSNLNYKFTEWIRV